MIETRSSQIIVFNVIVIGAVVVEEIVAGLLLLFVFLRASFVDPAIQ